VGTFAPLHWLMAKPCETCSAMKWPNTENLLLKLWSMRTTSSRRFVGVLLVPWNRLPFVGAGKIPAVTNAAEFGAIMHDGMMFPGKLPPCTTPAGAVPPGQFAKRTLGATWAVVGTLIGVVTELKLPPYVAGSGTTWPLFRLP